MNLLRTVLGFMCVSLVSAVTVLSGPPLNCSQQDLMCTVQITNCVDSEWRYVHDYTPSSPEELQVSVHTMQDETGHLQPVLFANWKLRDDGSIRYVKATELHVLVTPTNQNLCVRYSFKEKLPMRNPSGEKWAFSANMLVLEPGQRYWVSVVNIPKPELLHSGYNVSTEIIVPDCQDHTMKRTQFCIERGYQWQPNISLAQSTTVSERSALTVSFSPDRLCKEYIIIVTCSFISKHEYCEYKWFDPEHKWRIGQGKFQINSGEFPGESALVPFKDWWFCCAPVAQAYWYLTLSANANHTTLDVTFSLDKWPSSCCQFDAEIKPLFPKCGQDCARRKRTLNICPVKPTDAPDVPPYTFVIFGVMFMCVMMAVILYVICRKPGKPAVDNTLKEGEKPRQPLLKQSPKVLVIYSQDHHLYRDIVLKLCAFLQAKCGTKVLVDLLDSTSVGMVGRLRWLEWQRQQLKNPSDKILILCSQGVQAKWRAMCGQGQVTLREDTHSPTDDMLTPFLNLFLPDMHSAGMLGKYMVAYFDDISSEQDVPSVFDIAVKYKLMKHFEELYFRILDIEKYQPGHVNHIKGIGREEYFNCPQGEALKNAIEAFQAYQLENPNWFEKECMDGEEEVKTEANMLIDQLQIPPVLECVPVIRDGLPGYINEVQIHENGNSVHVLTPELNTECKLLSLAEITPLVNDESKYQYPSIMDEVLTNYINPHSPSSESVYIMEPVLNKPSLPRQNCLFHEPLSQVTTEGEEENFQPPRCQLSSKQDLRSSGIQNSPDSNFQESSSMQSKYFPPFEISHIQPVEMEEYEVLEPSEKGLSSGSDQGYISKLSSQHDPPFKEDPLVTLRRLQEEQFR